MAEILKLTCLMRLNTQQDIRLPIFDTILTILTENVNLKS